MIDYIKGDVAELTPTAVTLETNNIGYFINISLNVYSVLSNQKSAKLYIYEVIREDAHLLFGFYDKQERQLFTQLITVSGIGANTARMILSSFPPQDLINVISTGNVDALKSVKGIGLKTAQRVIVDLKDKIGAPSDQAAIFTASNQSSEEALAALVMLGFNQQASQKAVVKIIKETPNSTVEEIIKTALKML